MSNGFSIVCTNCGVSKAVIDHWMLGAEKNYKEAGLGTPQYSICCEGPYVTLSPLTCTLDLLRRSLPGGEDR
jgi:hypothetical protein